MAWCFLVRKFNLSLQEPLAYQLLVGSVGLTAVLGLLLGNELAGYIGAGKSGWLVGLLFTGACFALGTVAFVALRGLAWHEPLSTGQASAVSVFLMFLGGFFVLPVALPAGAFAGYLFERWLRNASPEVFTSPR